MPRAVESSSTTPTRCPFCDSEAVVATAPKITSATYWRCERCGQLWHPARLLPRAFR